MHRAQSHCTRRAVHPEAADDVIDLALAHAVAFGKEGDDVGRLLAQCVQPLVVGIEADELEVVELEADGIEPRDQFAVEVQNLEKCHVNKCFGQKKQL